MLTSVSNADLRLLENYCPSGIQAPVWCDLKGVIAEKGNITSHSHTATPEPCLDTGRPRAFEQP